MIRPQRKYHRFIWITMLLLLPAGIVFAWLSIPVQAPVKLLNTGTSELLPSVIRSASNNDFTAELRVDASRTKWQLVWKNKKILTVPSAVIYDVTGAGNDLKKARLVGRIESRGEYRFDLPADSSGHEGLQLVLYDFIHGEKINSINL